MRAVGGVCTLQSVEYGEEVNEGDQEGPPGKEGEAPGEAQQDHQAADAAYVCQQPPAGGLVVGVLPLDAGQLDHDQDEDEQAQSKDQEEVGDHARVEGDVITQPAAAGGQRRGSVFTPASLIDTEKTHKSSEVPSACLE